MMGPMMTSVFRFLPLALASIGVACGADSTVSALDKTRSTSSTLAVAPGQAGATGVVRGVIFGERLVLAADTAGAATMPDRVAGATVDVSREFRDSTSDTGPVTVTTTRLGTIVSDANGTFVLTSVAPGHYRFAVTPPSGSPYKPATFGGESFDDSDTQATAVYLHSK
jgi:hypothetical protein